MELKIAYFLYYFTKYVIYSIINVINECTHILPASFVENLRSLYGPMPRLFFAAILDEYDAFGISSVKVCLFVSFENENHDLLSFSESKMSILYPMITPF